MNRQKQLEIKVEVLEQMVDELQDKLNTLLGNAGINLLTVGVQ